MLFMVGIETPANESEAWGAIAPIFENYGYGCVAAADEESAIVDAMKDAILDILQEMHNDGKLVKLLDTGYKDYSEAFPDYERWIAIEVDNTVIKGKKERFNVSWDTRFLKRVDSHVKTSGLYSDRSDFLAVAVDEKMRQQNEQR